MADDEFLESLKKVEEVDAIIKQLSAGDEGVREEAEKKCDDFMKKHGISNNEIKKEFNRTVINDNAFNTLNEAERPAENRTNNMEPAAFMAAVEADIKARAARREEAMKVATEFKNQGNAAFSAGNYTEAIRLYTEGLYKVRDYQVLYTNRAQAYIKLEQYKEAIEDCEWALKVSDDCVKAYIHKGRALMALQQYDEAIACFEKAMSLDEKTAQSIREDYLIKAEVAKKRSMEDQSQSIAAESTDDAVSVESLLKKVNKDGHIAMYYSGGLNLLAQYLTDNEKQTAFRCKGGFRLLETCKYLGRSLASNPRSLASEEIDMCQAAFSLFEAAVKDNVTNQCALLEEANFSATILSFIDAKFKLAGGVRLAAACLLHQITTAEAGRLALLRLMDHHRLLVCLLGRCEGVDSASVPLAYSLLNLSLSNRFQPELHTSLQEHVLPAVERLLSDKSDPEVHASVVYSLTTVLSNLCVNAVSLQTISQRSSLWTCLTNLLVKKCQSTTTLADKQDDVTALAGLLANMSTASSGLTDQPMLLLLITSSLTLTLSQQGHGVLGERYLILIGRLCAKYPELLLAKLCADDFVVKLISIIRREGSTVRPAIRTLAVCTQFSPEACNQVVNNKALKLLADLIKSSDEQTVGNAALCLTHCVEVPKVPAALTKTDVIGDLLTQAGDGKNELKRQNCARLIARLAKADQRHMDRLRELNGLRILHDVQKNVTG